jgi:hypothetical protein
MQPAIHQEKNPDIYRFDVHSLFLVNHPVYILYLMKQLIK